MTKRAYDKIAEGLEAAAKGPLYVRIPVDGVFHNGTVEEYEPGVWVAKLDDVPGFIVSGRDPFEAERKIRDHLPDFLAA